MLTYLKHFIHNYTMLLTITGSTVPGSGVTELLTEALNSVFSILSANTVPVFSKSLFKD